MFFGRLVSRRCKDVQQQANGHGFFRATAWFLPSVMLAIVVLVKYL